MLHLEGLCGVEVSSRQFHFLGIHGMEMYFPTGIDATNLGG